MPTFRPAGKENAAPVNAAVPAKASAPLVRHLDHDADEALGPVEGRRGLREGGPRSVSRHGCGAADEGSRDEGAGDDQQEIHGHGQGVRSGEAG